MFLMLLQNVSTWIQGLICFALTIWSEKRWESVARMSFLNVSAFSTIDNHILKEWLTKWWILIRCFYLQSHYKTQKWKSFVCILTFTFWSLNTIESPTQWRWIWANFKRQWRTEEPRMGSWRIRHHLAIEQQQ